MGKYIPDVVAERAATRYVAEGECHVSTYSRASHGYAQIGWSPAPGERSTMTTAHRAAYVYHSGAQIPDDMTVDHICHNRPCVRIEHLRLLSNSHNARRNRIDRDFPMGWACRRGHDESDRKQVTRTKNGRKVIGWTCRRCEAISRAKYYANNSEKVKAAHKKYNDARPRKTDRRWKEQV